MLNHSDENKEFQELVKSQSYFLLNTMNSDQFHKFAVFFDKVEAFDNKNFEYFMVSSLTTLELKNSIKFIDSKILQKLSTNCPNLSSITLGCPLDDHLTEISKLSSLNNLSIENGM